MTRRTGANESNRWERIASLDSYAPIERRFLPLWGNAWNDTRTGHGAIYIAILHRSAKEGASWVIRQSTTAIKHERLRVEHRDELSRNGSCDTKPLTIRSRRRSNDLLEDLSKGRRIGVTDLPGNLIHRCQRALQSLARLCDPNLL